MTLVFFFDKLNKIPLYLLLFLIPIFFLPFSQDVLDYPKQIISTFLILLSLIGWLGKKTIEGKGVLVGDKIFYFALFLIFFSVLLSSIFSLWPRASFWGYQDFGDSFLTILLFLILVFLVLNLSKEKTEYLFSLCLLLLSGAIAGIFNLFQLYKIFLFPFNFTKELSFNTIGTINSLAIFAVSLLPLALILTFKTKGFWKIILGIVSFSLFLNIVLINFKTAWLSLIIAILVLFIFGFREKIKIAFVGFLMFGLVLSIFFYFFPIPLPGFPVLPLEVSLTSNSEIYILKGSFNESIKNIILGTGPGTFLFDYSQYRSPLLNQTLFWGTRFLKGGSTFLDWVLTKGILGGASLIFLYFLIIYFVFKYLRKGREQKDSFEIKLGLTAGILSLIFVSFFYPFNFSLFFIFCFLVGGFFLYFSSSFRNLKDYEMKTSSSFQNLKNSEMKTRPKEIKINFSSSFRTMVANSIFIILIAASIGLFFLQGQRYFAEMKYLKGIQFSQAGNLNGAIDELSQATKLNPSLDIYWRDLSQIYLTKANLISQEQNLSLEERRRLANLAITSGAEAINQTVSIAPINVANWNVRGFFYRNLIGVEGAGEVALASYQKAIQLEPASPFAFTEKARVHILMAQDFSKKGKEDLKQEHLNFAIESLKKAIELKSDYAPGHYLLAVVYDQQGKLEQAISKLEETKIVAPQDSGIAFQLGLLYWRSQQFDEAQTEFERAVSLNPDYSNARYMLGLVYDEIGEKEKAKQEFEKLVELNPENQQVKKILENLEKGLPALEGITLSQPPIQEGPPEIKK